MNKFSLILSFSFAALCVFSQNTALRIEPPNWYTEMQNPNLQLMVHAKDIGESKASLKYSGVSLKKVHLAESPNYLFLDIEIGKEAKPGSIELRFELEGGRVITHQYPLHKRQPRTAEKINQGDVIYLITPDRFVNGDITNDNVEGLKESAKRSFHGGRHGGDLEGIASKLDYFNELGVTTLWLNPVLENDMAEYSYHGYSTTDYYKVDPRYGSNQSYQNLSTGLHQRKMKLIKDLVFNHCGSEHWWMKDMPYADWINHVSDYKNTNHAAASLSDPHGAESDRSLMETGWFVKSMPDLNQSNPFMAMYLIQNSIWWVEFAQLDGIRMDTYPYNNAQFMRRWSELIRKEFPGLFIVGETWVTNEAQEAYWAKQDESDPTKFYSGVTSTTDFPLCFAVHNSFKQGGNVMDVYNVLSKDFLYFDPFSNMTFVDNHDMDRFYYSIGEDLDRFKMAMALLFTTRGIPQIYYGIEILLHKHGQHGDLREDFPGGWIGDNRNAFVAEGRNSDENKAFNYLKTLLQWRGKSDAIKNGSLKHFVPIDNVYVFNRKSKSESVLVVINNNYQEKTLDLNRYKEVLMGYTHGIEVLSNKKMSSLNAITVGAKTPLIIELKH